MHVSNILLVTTCWVGLLATALRSAFDGPHTFNELRIALKRLGVADAETIPTPLESLNESRAVTAPSHLCIATVGTLNMVVAWEAL